MPRILVLLAAFFGPLALAFWSHRVAVRPRTDGARPSFFAFAQRTQWVGLLAMAGWITTQLDLAMPWLRTLSRHSDGPSLAGPVAALILLGPPLVVFAVIGLLGHDVARRANLTDWTWRDALGDAFCLVGGGISAVSLLIASAGALLAGSIRLGLVGLLGAFLVAAVIGSTRRRGAGLTLHAVTSGALRDRVFALARHAGVKLKQLYVVPLRRFRLANAFAVQGEVVMLTDVLLEHLDRDEVDAVLAHEMAHLARKDPAKLARGLLLVAVAIAIPAGFNGWIGASVALPLAMLGYLAFTRHIEFATDAKAVALGATPEALVTGLARLSRLSQVPVRWSPAREWLMTHPSLERRARRLAAVAGADAGHFVALADDPPPAGERWGMPEAVAVPRMFGSEFRRRVLGRLTWSLLLASVLVPAVVIGVTRALATSGVLVTPRIVVLAAAVLGGFVAWQLTWAILAHRPLAALEHALGPRLRAAIGADERDGATFFVGLAPGAAPRLYEGFAEWDVGSLDLTPERCAYAGEETRFSVVPHEVAQTRLDMRLPGWIRIPLVRVHWERADGSAGAFGLVPIGESNVFAARAEARRLHAALEAWRVSGAQTRRPGAHDTASLGAPPTMDVTSASPRSLLQANAIVLTWVIQVILAFGASLAFGLPGWPTETGAVDVAFAAVCTHVLAMLPFATWREPAGAVPTVSERCAA